jgi:hypothetical protein
MTRHGLVENPAADATSPATDPRATTVNIAADRVARVLMRDPPDRAEAQRSGLSASTMDLPSAGRANADIGRSAKSP